MSSLKRISRNASFGGFQDVYTHSSEALGCDARFAVYLPPQAATQTCPVVYFLSGLTCTEQNVVTKAGAQRACAEHGLILVCPDTSPRGDDVANDEAYDLGQGAGFYVNATERPWAKHYQMYDYVQSELPRKIAQHFSDSPKLGIMGHSMGGHGALVLGLRNPEQYLSVSAFSPIVAPTAVPWGQKALRAYLGPDLDAQRAYDACWLVEHHQGPRRELLVDQGDADEFLQDQLKPELLRAACERAQHPLQLRLQPGYDHSYYFIASFVADHLAHHAAELND